MSDDGEYEVGFGKPPKEHRIQKGEVRNPRGRPKRSQNFDTIINRELDTLTTVTEGGRQRRMSKREVTAKRWVNDAMLGKPGARSELIKYCERFGVGDPFVITAEDRETFAEAMRDRAHAPIEPPLPDDEDEAK